MPQAETLGEISVEEANLFLYAITTTIIAMSTSNLCAVGQVFVDLPAAKKAIASYVIDNGESYKVLRSEKLLYIICCKGDTNCKFSIRATTSSSKSKGPITSIRIMQPHTCSPATHYNFRHTNSRKYLMDHHRGSIALNRATTIAQIRCNEKQLYGNEITYLAAYRCRQTLREELDGKEEHDFAKMEDLSAQIEAKDTSSRTKLVIDQMSDPCRNAWQSMRPFLAVDACHCISRYKQTLFIAVGVDGDNQILPLCWGIAQGENFQNWLLFLQFVKSSLYDSDNFDEAAAQTRATLVIMSDRQKGLKKALQEVFQGASMAHCAQHIAANIQSRYGIAARELWWPMVYARTKQEYDIALQALKAHNHHAGIYAQKINPELYAAYAFPVPRFGHNTSNIVESLNGSWKDIRNMTPLHMLCSIWSTVMETVANRQNRQFKEAIICQAIKHLFDKRLATARRYQVILSSSTVFQVTNEEGKDYIVNLRKKTCSCAQFREYGGPCSHAIQAAKAVQVDPYTLFREEYLVSEYKQGYRYSIPPILFQDLAMNHIQPPLVTRRAGRPPTKRVRKRTALQDRTNRCSNVWCRERGHNKRSCQTVETEGEVIDREDETTTGMSSSEDEGTRVSRIARAKVVRKRGLIAKALGMNLRSGKRRAVELSSGSDIALGGGSKTGDTSDDEEGNKTLDEIVVAT
jgi:hypothetical protein